MVLARATAFEVADPAGAVAAPPVGARLAFPIRSARRGFVYRRDIRCTTGWHPKLPNGRGPLRKPRRPMTGLGVQIATMGTRQVEGFASKLEPNQHQFGSASYAAT
jgi:hypothetical protein